MTLDDLKLNLGQILAQIDAARFCESKLGSPWFKLISKSMKELAKGNQMKAPIAAVLFCTTIGLVGPAIAKKEDGPRERPPRRAFVCRCVYVGDEGGRGYRMVRQGTTIGFYRDWSLCVAEYRNPAQCPEDAAWYSGGSAIPGDQASANQFTGR